MCGVCATPFHSRAASPRGFLELYFLSSFLYASLAFYRETLFFLVLFSIERAPSEKTFVFSWLSLGGMFSIERAPSEKTLCFQLAVSRRHVFY